MSVSHQVTAFVAGEVSPDFYNRTDLSKYPLGLSECRNFYVKFEGGVNNRPGSQFIGQAQVPLGAMRMLRFRATGNDFVLLFEPLTMRVVRNGAYETEAAKALTAVTQADPAVVTSAAHGYANGDWVRISGVVGMTEINDRLFEVANVTATTFELVYPGGDPIDSTDFAAYTSGGEAARVFTLTTPYTADDIPNLRLTQNKREAYITEASHDPHLLTFVAGNNWTLAELEIAAEINAPTGVALTPSSAGTAGIAFAVTSVDASGIESLASPYALTELSVDYTVTAGSMKVTWAAVSDAVEYNIYRSLVLPTGADISLAQEVGFLGRSRGPQFIDRNITPDFTKTPPLALNPFAHGAVASIEVTAGGTGYAKSDTITVTGGGGSGFEGYPIVNDSGVIIAVAIVKPGSGYTSATATVITSGGSGATFTVNLGAQSGNSPAVSARFQQRLVFAGTDNLPDTLWGSKPGDLNNFDVSTIPIDSDAYDFIVDSVDVNPIRHLVALRSGLLIFTNYGVYQLRASQGAAVTPTNALADPQAYKGVSGVEPLAVDTNILFTQQEGSAIYALNYTYYTESFQLQDISVLASHLLTNANQITRMEFLEEPDKLIYAGRVDGTRLMITYEPEQEVVAFTRDETQGLYHDHVVVLEGDRFTMYQAVDRYINGIWQRFIERQQYRDFTHTEDSWFVDAGLTLTSSEPAAQLVLSAAMGDSITATASASVWSSGDVGDIIYAGGGKLEITAYTSGTSVTVRALRDVAQVVPQQEGTRLPVPFAAGTWQQITPVSSVSNLWHLEGEVVAVLADGDVLTGLTVVNGAIDLDGDYTKVLVGLAYTARATVLPPSSLRRILTDKRKTFQGAAVHVNQTRGLAMGPLGGRISEIPNRSYEDWGEPIRPLSGNHYQVVHDIWRIDAQMVFEQSYPLPASVLGLTTLIEIGDD